MRVVIVDDEARTRKGLQQLLSEKEGIDVCGVYENPQEALESMQNNPPDVLITDIRMPQLSGLELIQAIREKWPQLNIIILSGYRDFGYAQQAISVGVSRYLTKPTDPEELLAALAGLQNHKEPEAQPEVANQMVQATLDSIEQHYAERISLKSLAETLYVSPPYLCKLFKKHTGQNLSEYLAAFRVHKAKQLLQNPRCKVAEVAELVGFNDARYFSTTFKKYCGFSPLEYRNRQGG